MLHGGMWIAGGNEVSKSSRATSHQNRKLSFFLRSASGLNLGFSFVFLSSCHCGVPLTDLISERNIGLMKAVERFDSNKGGKLSTYGSWRMKTIKRALVNQSKST